MKRLLIILIFIVSIFLLGCTKETSSGCGIDEDCESWQTCNKTEGTCQLAEAFCNIDEDCNDPLKVCNANTHECIFKEGKCLIHEDCENWQSCDTLSYECIAKENYCINTNECEEYFICSNTYHQCIPEQGKCTEEYHCETWEECNQNSVIGRCEAISGRYNSNRKSWLLVYNIRINGK